MTSLRRIVAASFLIVGMIATTTVGGSQKVIAKDGDVLVFYCQNLAIATVRVFPNRVEVETPSRRATLVETPPSSAVRYSDGSVTLSGLEEYVRLEEPGAVYFCRSIPAEVPWQEARFRGIEFRAAGDEPPWSLEVDSGVVVEFATGLGDARTVTKFPPAELTGPDSRRTLVAVAGSVSLSVVAERRVCTLAGSTMTLSVTVTIDGKTYRGCGRPLIPPLPEP
jgi:putative lipoprotein